MVEQLRRWLRCAFAAARPLPEQAFPLHDPAVAMRNAGFALLALGLWMVPGHAAARDRPGTPTSIDAYVCQPQNPNQLPRLCLEFFNTADEKVIFEWDTTRAGQPIPAPNSVGCVSSGANPSMCLNAIQAARGVEGKGKVAGDFPDLQFATEYCFRVRARRTGDSVVSELWTAWTCARTPRQPDAPTKPRVDVEFVTRNPASGGTSDRADHLIVSTSGGGDANLLTEVTGLGNYTYSRPTGRRNSYDWTLSPNDDRIKITACAKNYTGTACTNVEASVRQKAVLSDDSGQTPIRSGSAGTLGFAGTWRTVTSSGGHFALTFQFNGPPIPGQPLSIIGTFVNTDGAHQYDGTLQGTAVYPSGMLNYTYSQPGIQAAGTGYFALSSDGKSITGQGVHMGKDKFDWNGTR